MCFILEIKNGFKLDYCYKSCLQKILVYNVKSIAFCSGATGIRGFHHTKADKMVPALSGSGQNQTILHVNFVHNEKANYEIYKDLNSTFYFTESKHYLTNGYMKDNAVSRAILQPVYWFGIPNSDPQNLKSVKINLSKNRQMTVHGLVPQCALSVLSFSECKIAKIFQGFAPGSHQAPPKNYRIWH